ncbi:MAG TPA: signal recognition particle-docking protein FtsY [Flexilinea sp.]|jgi:fused signal recognition particle receptor|nr:signal recognition particle-docking protein FtsY [Flexilinea sp.]HNY18570.1 signal recognition particle-docking protein FtsY [Flexilinea sp.]HOG20920.1 signal recognition particle-docking protein FtsY [Flexilinea sp.]HOP00768.1 signal recognition particle-docking protein FtsY [Flexilinea sp.]HOR55068.1 signal recognition particle-docking protein FtsY [Flexilinea sp.]
MAEFLSKWMKGLDKTRKVTFSRLASVLGTNEIDEYLWDDLEAILIQADIGVETSNEIIESLKKTVLDQGLYKSSDLVAYLKNELIQRLPESRDPLDESEKIKPYVILMVGVNGSGKTTTTAKLAKKYTDAGKKVMIAAGDTYRAAAIEQLQVWGNRLNIPVIAGKEGGDSAAVAFDAVQAAIARNMDILIIDTAGRLQSRYNLMEELKKVHRVIGKALPGAPHAVWIVLDATTGQNALIQAKAFKEAVKVNGVILAKLDNSAKGGMAFAITQELDLPIIYAGLGEKADDLERFNREDFVNGIIGD